MPRHLSSVAFAVLLGTAATGAQANPWLTIAPGSPAQASAINGHNVIVGYYTDSGNLSHGFQRTPDGTLTTIDVPDGRNTQITANNIDGDLTGHYVPNGDTHTVGFVRSAARAVPTFATFSVPGASYTMPAAINAKGVVAGVALAPGYIGFVRTPDGTLTTISIPSSDETVVKAIDNKGSVVGYYLAGESYHGFLRDRRGEVTVIDMPGAGHTLVYGINNKGVMTGAYYLPGDSSAAHGFVRAADGSFATFDPPGAHTTTAQSINFTGQVAGFFTDADDTRHGFVRDTDGTITQLDAPGATNTYPAAIAADGKVVGAALAITTTTAFRVNALGWKSQ